MAAALLFATATAALQPPYPAPIAASIQPWSVTTLRQQIHEKHVTKVAFHSDGHPAVEVLDYNGLQRHVDLIFPAVEKQIVEDLRTEHVPFYVHTEPEIHALVVRIVRSILLTLVVIWLIDIFGFLPDLIWGCYLMGLGLMKVTDELNLVIDDAEDGVRAGLGRHSEAVDALMLSLFRSTAADSYSSTASGGGDDDDDMTDVTPRRARWSSLEQQQQQPVPILVDDDDEQFDL